MKTLLQEQAEAFVEQKQKERMFNRAVLIVEDRDGHLTIQTYDGNGKPLGGKIYCNDRSHAWQVYAILTDSCGLVPHAQLFAQEDTQEIDISEGVA